MSRHIVSHARRLASDLRATEHDCDVALATKARLVASMLDVRREAGVPASTCRLALDSAVEAISFATKARSALLDAHAELARLNLRELGTGDLSECPAILFSGPRLVEPDAQAG